MPRNFTHCLLLAAMFAVPFCACAQATLKAAPAAAARAAQGFVAGLAPDRRPADAPVIREAITSPALLAYRLHGVSEPIPQSVMVMAEQGSHWYSPFFRPGMTGPYDLRHWHPAAP